jgi:hypothetical protein
MAAGLPAMADDSEDVDLTIEVTAPATGNLLLTFAKVQPDVVVPFFDGQAGNPGGALHGFLGKITVTDTRTTPTGWDLSLQFSPFERTGTMDVIPIGGLTTAGTAWEGDPAPGITTYFVESGTPEADSSSRPIASAPTGTAAGIFDLDAGLTLDVPVGTVPGLYTSTVTIDLVGG